MNNKARYFLILLLLPCGIANADRYKVKKVMRQSDKAVIITGEDGDFIERGDRLYLENDFGACKVRVLKTKPTKALISLRACDFEVNIRDIVTDDRVHGVEYSTEPQRRNYWDDPDEEDEGESEDSDRKEISTGRYVGGGIASLFLGLGIGHAIQGRYADWGWVHTVMQLGGIVIATIGQVEVDEALGIHEYPLPPIDYDKLESGRRTRSTGYLLLIGSRIAEIIGVWIINEDRYKIVSNDKQLYQKGSISLLPTFNDKGDVELQLALSIPIK